jgi:hypothetical protein
MKNLVARVILAYKKRLKKVRKKRPLKDRLKARRYYRLHRNAIRLKRSRYMRQNKKFLKKRKSFKRSTAPKKFKSPVLNKKTVKKKSKSIHAPKRK